MLARWDGQELYYGGLSPLRAGVGAGGDPGAGSKMGIARFLARPLPSVRAPRGPRLRYSVGLVGGITPEGLFGYRRARSSRMRFAPGTRVGDRLTLAFDEG